MRIDLSSSSPLIQYKILNNAITPRPIAWISSTDENGIVNLAPFSFFAPISSDPIIFALCMLPKSDGSLKDTLKNIIKIKKATICMCDEKNIKSLDNTSTELEYGASEATNFDIELQIIENEYPPIIKGVQIAFMCDFYDLLDTKGSSTSLLLEAKKCFIDDKIYRQDLNFVLKNVGRTGKYYQFLGPLIDSKNLS